MNKSDLEKMQKCQEEYEKFFEDTPFQREIDKIARDIRERQDNAMAMEFTRIIAELLRENGIVINCRENSFINSLSDKNITKTYGVVFDSVDCTEHDKEFTDKIAKLEEENERLRKSYDRHRRKICDLESELSVKENLLKIKNGLCGEKSDYEKLTEEMLNYELENKEDDIAQFNYESIRKFVGNRKTEDRIAELEDRHQSDCITINQLHTALDVMTEKYQRLREVHNNGISNI